MIIFEVKPSTKCFEDFSLYITSNYNPDVIHIIKSKAERYWLPNIKAWEVPLKYMGILQEELKHFDVRVIENTTSVVSLEQKPKIEIPADYKFKTKPYEHQLEGIKYGLNNDSFLLGDEQGLGKTMQVINIACIKKQLYDYKHCLIICGVNGLKWNWQSEIKKHSDFEGYILGTRKDTLGRIKIGSVSDRITDLYHLKEHSDDFPYFLITNVETLRSDDVQKILKELCNSKIINIIAFDEFHKCKNPTSQQGKAILKLKADNMIAMTGTPLMNTPIDLYMPLKWLGYEDHSFYAFRNHFCTMGGYGNYQIVGYKNLEQLKSLLDECCLRRLKQDVLDLPEKIYTTDFVEMSPKQSKIYKEVKMEIKENIDMIKGAVNPLAEMIRLRQATGYTGILSSTIQESVKIDRLEELLEEIVANGKKAIVFSNWVAMTTPIYQRLKQYNPALITGETKDRVEEQNRFMNDNNCKVIIGTTGAMGTGLTLTAASYVIFVDEPWNRALREQAEDRAHRIGTTENINIIFLICKDTIDERIHQIVETKGAMADMLVDGKMDFQDKSELVDFLLS